MKRNLTLGAVLIGVGAGLLINNWFPGLRFLWPLGLIAGGVLLWREVGPYSARVALIAAALTIPLFGGFGWSWSMDLGGGRELARLESNDEDESSWEGLERLLIVNTAGDISVEADDNINVEVVYRGNRRAEVPKALQADYDTAKRTLRIIGVDPKLSERERRNLGADIAISVPENVQVEVVNNTGDVTVSEVAGATLETNTGDIHASDISGTTSARSDTGDVRLENILGEIEATTNVGDISINLAEPLGASLTAKSDVGDINLELPSDSNVSITATSDSRDLSGDLDQLTSNEGRLRLGSGEYPVELSTNVGGVSVKER
jgi:Putative adhesin